MKTLTAPLARTTSRADAQRERILCAALKCFIEHGFHAASMANIADAAQMSAGLMYRYFDNKQAIVLAIVERQLDEKRAVIRQLHSAQDLASCLLQAYQQWSVPDAGTMSVALLLEMTAEATRNPGIAAALRRSDEITRVEFQSWLSRPRAEGGAGLTDELADLRALQMRCVVDGLAVRAAREPDLELDKLRAALDDLFHRLLP